MKDQMEEKNKTISAHANSANPAIITKRLILNRVFAF